MGLRVAGVWQHPRSKNYWFRMAVPERLRARVGKREFKFSLDTTNPQVARARHADKLAEVQALLARHEAEALVSVGTQANGICQRGLDALARSNLRANDDGVTELADAEDNVARGMLKFLAYRTRLTWGQVQADLAELELTGELDGSMRASADTLPLSFVDAADQAAFVSRSKALAGDPRNGGYVDRDIARALLARHSWAAAEYEVLLVASAANEPVKTRTPLYDALAERVLRHLAQRRFRNWPSDIEKVVPPMAITPPGEPAPVVASPSATPASQAPVRRLADALDRWRANRGLKPGDVDKTYDEWKLAVDRFADVHNDPPLDRIARAMVIEFRDLMTGMPSRPAKAIAALPVREQVAKAAELELPTLAPASIKKHVAAIRSLLEIAAVEQEWIPRNVAAKIDVAGSGYVGDERDRLSDADMQTIYGSSYLTDPDACDDTMFWIMFMAPFQGARPGEHCKVRPADVDHEDGVPMVRIRRRRPKAGGDETTRRGVQQKTESSIRDVPLHWILEEAGFMDFAAFQKERGAEWLFDDLVPDRYGDRYRFLSRRINAVLDQLGVDASEKAFYSTRHTSKRETRRRRVSEQSADQIHGHSDGRVGRKYGQGMSLEDLKQDIDKLEFAGVDWDAVVACARFRVARLLATRGER